MFKDKYGPVFSVYVLKVYLLYLVQVKVTCSYSGGLCDMAIGVGSPPIFMSSSMPMCTCPGNTTCPSINDDDPSRVLQVESGT